MMDDALKAAFIAGAERLSAWADLIDSINVFPVADGDTGRNLAVSLAPLRCMDGDPEKTIRQLLFAAAGNSGNIAARFFAGFLTAQTREDLPEAAQNGRDAAWAAVADPKAGTMLTIFDVLAQTWEKDPEGARMIEQLEEAVKSTPDLLPELNAAGVADAGALGMFIFFEGFFASLHRSVKDLVPATERFKNLLRISADYRGSRESGHCISAVIRLDRSSDAASIEELLETDESLVVLPEGQSRKSGKSRESGSRVKVHFHTEDAEKARKRLGSAGAIETWGDEDLGEQTADFGRTIETGPIHIMTDGAGSITRAWARRYGITLLDSYILAGERAVPETAFSLDELYSFMRSRGRVSTSQASVFERHQHYESILSRHEKALYLCVGSVYTGNYETATAWKGKNDPQNRLTVIDTGAASGRLGLSVIATARMAQKADDPAAVIRYAKKAVAECEEYIFLDSLRYLAAGGRLSKTKSFFGDMLKKKPVISPLPGGAEKAGVVRDSEGQVRFALEKLERAAEKGGISSIMLEYTDNREWVEDKVQKEIRARYPDTEILLMPMSLTSGVHMGPGTWGVAVLPRQKY